MKKAYVDIETTGLSPDARITVFTIHDGSKTEQYVNGRNLRKFARAIKEFDTLSGFNIKSFDLPRLQKQFGIKLFAGKEIEDLMHKGWAVGLRGGLKQIEKVLQIPRQQPDMDGRKAALLGRKMFSPDTSRAEKGAARARLTSYKREDTENLKILDREISRRKCSVY